MLIAAGKTGKIVNIKKAQFLNAEKMKYAVEKVKSTGNKNVWLTERGTLFGPSELVVDFRNIQKLSVDGPCGDGLYPCCSKRQGNDGKTGGNRAYVPFLHKRPSFGGLMLIFETHPNPDQGLSDGPNMIKLSDLDTC